MSLRDSIIALVCGRVAGFFMADIMTEFGVTDRLQLLVVWVLLPIFAWLCLWLAKDLGKRKLFIFQGGKLSIVGIFAIVADLKIFELFAIMFLLLELANPLAAKAISFFISTLIKYVGNKYWTFEHSEIKENFREIFSFFAITAVGVVIDIFAFTYLVHHAQPIGISQATWIKISVIIAALVAAIHNFICYKFVVFKR